MPGSQTTPGRTGARDAERPLSAIRFRYVPPAGRQRSIPSRMDPCVEVYEVALELLRVLVPRNLVDIRPSGGYSDLDGRSSPDRTSP